MVLAPPTGVGLAQRLEVRVGMGELAVDGSLRYHEEGRSQRFEGVLGKGLGGLKVSVGMGEVEVSTP